MGLLARLAAQSLCSSPPWLLNGYLAWTSPFDSVPQFSLSVTRDGGAEGKDRNTKAIKNT